jgi:hypothetical protein
VQEARGEKRNATISAYIDERRSEDRGVLEFAREERNDSSGEVLDRRAGAAGGQIHFPSLCDVGGAGRGEERAAAFFLSRGLPQHTGLHESPGRGGED